MACTYTVLEEYDDARYFSSKAVKTGKKGGFTNTVDNAQMLSAIIEDKDPEGDKESIPKTLDDLIFKGHILADLNKRIIDGEDLSEISPPNVPISWMDGSVEEVKKSRMIKAEVFNRFTDFTLGELEVVMEPATDSEIEYKQGYVIIAGEFDDSKVHAVQNNAGKWLVFYVTLDSYKGASAYDIKLNDSKSKVIEKYGLPTSVMASQQGTLMYYAANRMIFLIDHKNEVERWILLKKM